MKISRLFKVILFAVIFESTATRDISAFVTTGDFNDDHKSDLAVANAKSASIAILLNSCH